ncbi:hypothetical protein [Neisseria uirgultaei]|uniref:hypothetical protein n=1 Tax=Neisseria uirgultaei TaxID=2830646 RepID=UPI0026590C07|nr:hypothetical protein [Neisseria uirgultaei]
MPSETSFDRFRRHSPILPRRFSGRFLLNAKYPVIPTKVGIQNVKSKETVFPDKFPYRQN